MTPKHAKVDENGNYVSSSSNKSIHSSRHSYASSPDRKPSSRVKTTIALNTTTIHSSTPKGMKEQRISAASSFNASTEEATSPNISSTSADEDQSSNPSVAHSTLLMTIATLVSRATGLVRTWVMAFVLGNSLITSAYQVANNMPNVIYELVAGGLLAAAFIPVYLLQKENLGPDKGNEFACSVLNLAIIVLGILSILATIFSPQVIATQTFTVDNQAEVNVYAVFFFRIFAAQIVFYGIGGVITGILNANRVYFLPSLAPALNNVVVIISFVLYAVISPSNPMLAIIVLAVGTTIGVVVQFVIQIPAMRKIGFRWKPKINLHDPALIEAVKIAIPTFIYIVGTMIAFSCRNAFSLQAGENGPSTLIYAWTWFQLPHGVVAVSLSRALFTELSEAAAVEDWNTFRQHVKSGISGTLLLIIPLAGLMIVFSQPIIQLFQAGAFSAEDVVYVAYILAFWVLCMPFYSVSMYLYNVFAGMRKFIIFAAISCVLVVVQCGLYAVLCNPDLFGIAGVPVADFAYYGSCCVISLIVLRKMIGNFGMKSILWTTVRVFVATVIGMVVGGLVLRLLDTTIPTSGIIGGLIVLFIGGVIGLIVIFVLCALFRVPEMNIVKNLIGKVKGKASRS